MAATNLPTDPSARVPTHRCTICGAFWILYPPSYHAPSDHPDRQGTWSLFSKECGKCCDNVAMGDQIETIHSAYMATRQRAFFHADRRCPETWVLYLLAHEEISIGKAREWLRHYIMDGRQDSLPAVEALPS